MITQIINFLKAWLRGDEAEVDMKFHFVITWLDIAVTVALLAILIYLWK
ncbi:hypothetical protein ORI89_19065 [Sphingobacterium sp. UT-1RO-CII-1]|nr:hypothetical protein [Sphingobacterium sp. UT-1RO-CII-1]MCY4781755.1 hypothetical protein [Sphingobacterium sp. UT-1RO-CII-1]